MRISKYRQAAPRPMEMCPDCDGTGKDLQEAEYSDMDCPCCRDLYLDEDGPCSRCNGTGAIPI